MFRRVLPFVVAMGLSCSHQDTADDETKYPVNNYVTSESGKTFYTGLVVPVGFSPKNVRDVLLRGDLPATFDWRDKVQLSPIESQGNCGACWAYSSSATFQDVLRINGENVDLSEQHLLSCAKPGEWSCNGGFFAHDRHMSPFGGVLATEYPYTASDTPCKPALTFRQKIVSWQYLPSDNYGNVAIDTLKQAILTYGPISVGVAADSIFSTYTGGIFKDTGSRTLNHAVNLVGWGKDPSTGQEYFIVRNSWGTTWGEKGWMRAEILNGKAANGLGAWANFVFFDKTNPNPKPPTPDPKPEPTPEPKPKPSPDPTPCWPEPKADTGWDETITVTKGVPIILGTRIRIGHRYYWTAEPAFEGGAKPLTAQLTYLPKIEKKLTLWATTRCGEAKDSVTVKIAK